MLTREEIEKMPAGREMDGLVVEHIFKHRRSAYGEQVVFETPDYRSNPLELGNVLSLRDVAGGREAVIAGKIPKSGWPTTLVDFYSTDIAAAWKVVAALNGTHFLEMLQRVRPQGGLYYAACFIGLQQLAAEYGKADTAPLAICRAALLTRLPAASASAIEGDGGG